MRNKLGKVLEWTLKWYTGLSKSSPVAKYRNVIACFCSGVCDYVNGWVVCLVMYGLTRANNSLKISSFIPMYFLKSSWSVKCSSFKIVLYAPRHGDNHGLDQQLLFLFLFSTAFTRRNPDAIISDAVAFLLHRSITTPRKRMNYIYSWPYHRAP